MESVSLEEVNQGMKSNIVTDCTVASQGGGSTPSPSDLFENMTGCAILR